ncbi:MAG: hypothetical protein K9M57_02400 [Phycisphaerae bacterium]|nr:hypothetical protein [Phycisphaerae bacterium]
MSLTAVNNLMSNNVSDAPQGSLREKASELVNNVFYGTLLRQFRDAQEPVLFGHGPGGDAFSRQMDMELIKRISQRGDAPLVDAIMKQITGDSNAEQTMKKTNIDAYRDVQVKPSRLDING